MLDNIRIILVGSQEPMNVGAVARAMQNFGLDDLWLVAPEPRVQIDLKKTEGSNAYRLAVHSGALLSKAPQVGKLAEAVQDCLLVAAVTARARDLGTGMLLTPREALPRLSEVAQQGKVALVFGREDSGLTNAEVDHAALLLRIPTSPKQPSLNLAQAVTLVAYELFMALQNPAASPQQPLAEQAALEGLYDDLERYAMEIGFTDKNRRPYLVRRFKRIFNKATLTPGEVQLLRGVLHQSRWYAKNAERVAGGEQEEGETRKKERGKTGP
jgi:tRNA/rRNA methyltransferase